MYFIDDLHTYMHTCMHTYTDASMNCYIHTYIHPCMHACVQRGMQTDRQTDGCTYVQLLIHAYCMWTLHVIYIHIHIHIYMKEYIHIYIYTYIYIEQGSFRSQGTFARSCTFSLSGLRCHVHQGSSTGVQLPASEPLRKHHRWLLNFKRRKALLARMQSRMNSIRAHSLPASSMSHHVLAAVLAQTQASLI